MANVGVYLENHLHDFHLADVQRIVEAAGRDHAAQGCRHADGWLDRVMEKTLKGLRVSLGEAMEAEETFCPERGIGAREAA